MQKEILKSLLEYLYQNLLEEVPECYHLDDLKQVLRNIVKNINENTLKEAILDGEKRELLLITNTLLSGAIASFRITPKGIDEHEKKKGFFNVVAIEILKILDQNYSPNGMYFADVMTKVNAQRSEAPIKIKGNGFAISRIVYSIATYLQERDLIDTDEYKIRWRLTTSGKDFLNEQTREFKVKRSLSIVIPFILIPVICCYGSFIAGEWIIAVLLIPIIEGVLLLMCNKYEVRGKKRTYKPVWKIKKESEQKMAEQTQELLNSANIIHF